MKRFGLDGKSHARTPMSTSVKICADLIGKQVEPTLYKSMIRSLLYLTASRPVIAFNVEVCAQFQANPKESHLTAVKRIIRYVIVVFIFLEKQILCLQDTLMQIGLEMLMIGKTPLEDVFMLVLI